MSNKIVKDQKEWGKVLNELESEHIKLASYDSTIMSIIGNIKGLKILDYGAGPGILALGLQKMGADVNIWDISIEMRDKASLKIGKTSVYNSLSDIPNNYFDFVICNLVFCIVPEKEVEVILNNIYKSIKSGGKIFIGFCNPKIFSIKESNLDIRFQTGEDYSKNHEYKKIKKEGNYEIIENHRPIEWYLAMYKKCGFKIIDTIYTPEYTLNKKQIKDFIIHKLEK